MALAIGPLLESLLQTGHHCKCFPYPTEMDVLPTQENNCWRTFAMASSGDNGDLTLMGSRWQTQMAQSHKKTCVNSGRTQRAGHLHSSTSPYRPPRTSHQPLVLTAPPLLALSTPMSSDLSPVAVGLQKVFFFFSVLLCVFCTSRYIVPYFSVTDTFPYSSFPLLCV